MRLQARSRASETVAHCPRDRGAAARGGELWSLQGQTSKTKTKTKAKQKKQRLIIYNQHAHIDLQ